MKQSLLVSWATSLLILCVIPPAGAAPAPAPAPADVDATAQVDRVVVNSSWTVPDDLMLRVRLTGIEPDEPFPMSWRHGGEGLGASVIRDDFAPLGYVKPADPPASSNRRSAPPTPPLFKVGQWSEPVSLRQIVGNRPPAILFLTINAGRKGDRVPSDPRRRVGQSLNVQFEIELMQGATALKQITAAGPLGGTIGLVLPFQEISPQSKQVPQSFVDGVCDLLTYARRRGEFLLGQPWAQRPLPQQFAFLTDLNGHGEGIYYGVRYTDPAIVETELNNLRQMGVNGVRGESWFVRDRIEHADGVYAAMRRVAGIHTRGYPVPLFVKGRNNNDPESGCPYAPGVPTRQQELIADTLKLLEQPYEEIWSLTEDEIGAAVDQSAQGKAHLSTCPQCIEAYRRYVAATGRSPGEFGVSDWNALMPIDVWAKGGDKSWQTHPQQALNGYYCRLFINHSSAQLFTPLRDAVAKANARKLAALESGDRDSSTARQPWLYTYALRGNTFLLRGHSLDFFDFYRLADNGFCHETSNRDPRVWNWDSYLLDVGRMIGREQGLALGLYVKPHRGAPVQRALAAACRGARMIFWYTYGPDYAKGDSFSERPEALALTSKAAHLLAAAEQELWLCREESPAQAAIIQPRPTEVWMQFTADNATQAAWEDVKFTYTALTHSFVPLDPLDETMLQSPDLGRYRVIYVPGPNFTRAGSARLMEWVESGGTLVLHAGGLSRDEANQPMADLYPKLGLRSRTPVEMWKSISPYATTMLHPFNDNHAPIKPVPSEAKVRFVAGPLAGQEAQPTVGREVLDPLPQATVLARYADGTVAAIQHTLGRGKVVLLGVFAGLEYTAPQRDGEFDMQRDLVPAWRIASAGVAANATDRPAWADQTNLELRRIINPRGQRSLAIMNFAYHVAGQRVREVDGRARKGNIHKLTVMQNVRITLPNADQVTEIRSAWLDKTLPIERHADGSITVVLPTLEEADVLVIR
jgi:hypothetical protein